MKLSLFGRRVQLFLHHHIPYISVRLWWRWCLWMNYNTSVSECDNDVVVFKKIYFVRGSQDVKMCVWLIFEILKHNDMTWGNGWHLNSNNVLLILAVWQYFSNMMLYFLLVISLPFSWFLDGWNVIWEKDGSHLIPEHFDPKCHRNGSPVPFLSNFDIMSSVNDGLTYL